MSAYAGTGPLLKLALRRDRLVIPLSVVGLVALAGGSAKSTVDLYQGQDAIDAARALLASPAIVGCSGTTGTAGVTGAGAAACSAGFSWPVARRRKNS